MTSDPTSVPAASSAPRRLWEAVKRILTRVGDFQARVLLTVFYFTFFAVFALLARRGDPLHIAPRVPSWQPRPPRNLPERETATRQA